MNTYATEKPDKEQEVIPAVTSIAVPNPEGDELTSLDHVDIQLDSKSRGINASMSYFWKFFFFFFFHSCCSGTSFTNSSETAMWVYLELKLHECLFVMTRVDGYSFGEMLFFSPGINFFFLCTFHMHLFSCQSELIA